MRRAPTVDEVEERMEVNPAVRSEARSDLELEPGALEPPPSPLDDVGAPVRDRHFPMARPTAHRFLSDGSARSLTSGEWSWAKVLH